MAYLFISFLLFITSIIFPTGIEAGYVAPSPEVYNISAIDILASSGIKSRVSLFWDLRFKSPFNIAGSFTVLILTLTDEEGSNIVVTVDVSFYTEDI